MTDRFAVWHEPDRRATPAQQSCPSRRNHTPQPTKPGHTAATKPAYKIEAKLRLSYLTFFLSPGEPPPMILPPPWSWT